MISIALLTFLSSCTKKKIPVGEYSFTFENTEGLPMAPITLKYEIIESTKEYMVLGNSYQDTLYKDETNITGIITYYGAIPESSRATIHTPFHITGTYEKNNGVYSINGTFISKVIIPNPDIQSMDTIDTSGTFEFKSIF